MRKLAVLCGVLVGCSPAFGDAIPACIEQSLATYFSLSAGCQIGGLVFSSFSYPIPLQQGVGLRSVDPLPADISVVPLIDSLRPGLAFRADWGFGPYAVDDYIDEFFVYDVRSLSGEAVIDGESATLTGEAPTGTHAELQSDALPSTGSFFYLYLEPDPLPYPYPSSDHKTFEATNAVTVANDLIVLQRYSQPNSVGVSEFTNRTWVAPEPTSALLFAAAILWTVAINRLLRGR